jgi:hypothetical protein
LTPSRRKVTTDAIKHDLLVFVEGEETEEQYLTHYRRLHRRNVRVEIDPYRGPPAQLVQRAAAAKKINERKAKREGRAHDEVWCVFDVDQHPNLSGAIDQARANGISLAISSPCLELWFLLHLQAQTGHINGDDVQALVQERLQCGKRLSAGALKLLEDNFTIAKDRARQLETKHEGDETPFPGNPSSGVWRLVDSITRQ